MKRQRGRGRKPGNPANRTYESNGPEVKIRGNASQIYDKYLQLARDASSSGDRVRAENLYQHAEHYYRIIQANQPKPQPGQEEGAENADASGEEQSGDQQQQGQERGGRRRGRGRDRGEQQHDPMNVVTPEGEAQNAGGAAAADGAERPSAEGDDEQSAPRRRTRRPRRSRSTDGEAAPTEGNVAEDVLESASAAADTPGPSDPDSAAA